jgi:hypothetical protein
VLRESRIGIGNTSLAQKRIPRTAQRAFQPHRSRYENVRLARFDFLKCADVEIGQFRQTLLRYASRNSFTAQVRAEYLELTSRFLVGHAVSCRRAVIDRTAQRAVNDFDVDPAPEDCDGRANQTGESGTQQTAFPSERRGEAIDLAEAFLKRGISTPIAMGRALDRKFRKHGRCYSQALWNAIALLDPSLSSRPAWAAIYRRLDAEEKTVTPAAGRRVVDRIVGAIIRELQAMNDRDMLNSGSSVLTNVWDEICAQRQGEESFAWDAYVETMQAIIDSRLLDLPRARLTAAWLATPQGEDWLCEADAGELATPNVSDVAEFILSALLRKAFDHSNTRIRTYLTVPYDDPCG